MVALAVSPAIDREAWLKERQQGIGSSEAAAAIGLSSYESRLGLYLKKTGALEPFEGNEATEWGLRLEPLVAEAYSERTGYSLPQEQIFVRNTVLPWQLATIDRIRSDGRIVELKTVGMRMAGKWGEPGSDEIPQEYLVQVLHQLAVTDTDVADVAALICGQELRIYTVERDDRAVAEIVDREAEFWDRVQNAIPPEPDPDRDRSLLIKLFPDAVGEIEFSAEHTDLVSFWELAKAHEKDSKEEKDRLQAQILATFGNAASAKLADGRVITRKIVSVAERTQIVKAYSYPLLKVKG